MRNHTTESTGFELSFREPHDRTYEHTVNKTIVGFHANNMGVVEITEEAMDQLLTSFGYREITNE